MATETVPMDDKELFNSAMADEAPAAVETPEPVAESPEQTDDKAPHPTDENRYADGTFRPQAKEADAAPTQQQPAATETPADETGNVPSWRHRELREERDALRRQHEEASRTAYAYQQQMADMQRQMAALQAPKQEPVGFFDDPDVAFKQRTSPIEDRINKLESDLRLNSSRALAAARHGWEAVAEAEKAVTEAIRANDPSLQTLTAQLRATDDPVGAAMQWYSNQKVMKETGGDIAKFKDKILADALKDPAYLAKATEAIRSQANPGTRPNIQLPPSLNRTPGSGVTASELDSEDMSDRALFKQAVAGGRGR